MTDIFTPNARVPSRYVWLIGGAWFLVWLAFWFAARPVIFPSLWDVVGAFPALWLDDGLGQELITSFLTNVQALALSAAIALPLAYLSRTPVVRPLAQGLSKLRFLSPAVFFLLLLFALQSGHQVKVAMLALGETVFLVTSMVTVVQGLPEEDFEDARTLRMSEWKATWYVVVRGTIPQALDAIRDNAAMGWSMLMMVEGIVRSEGGVGVMILNNEKHFNFAAIYAVALAILLVGIGQDVALGGTRRALCPYAEPRKQS